MSQTLFEEKHRSTCGDLRRWPGEQRWELIDGVGYVMTSPSRRHQDICRELTRQLANTLSGRICRACPAPLDVRLPDKE